jgi:hypothetical protein
MSDVLAHLRKADGYETTETYDDAASAFQDLAGRDFGDVTTVTVSMPVEDDEQEPEGGECPACGYVGTLNDAGGCPSCGLGSRGDA